MEGRALNVAATALWRGLPADSALHGVPFVRGATTQADALFVLDAQLGAAHLDADNLPDAQGCLERAMQHLEGGGRAAAARRRETSHFLRNQLGILWARRDRHELAREHLEQAAALYEQRGEAVADGEAYGAEAAEGLYAHTAFYLAQSYGALGRDQEAAQMCGETLTRQLTAAAAASSDGGLATLDARDWCANAAQLAGAFAGLGDLRAAEHCVLAAEAVWQTCRPDVGGDGEAGPDAGGRDSELSANLALARGKLHSARLERAAAARGGEAGGAQAEAGSQSQDGALPLGGVRGVTLPAPRLAVVATLAAGTYAQGCAEFRDAQRAFRAAMDFYVLDGFVTDHVNVLKALSQAHAALADFLLAGAHDPASADDDAQRFCRIHRRRSRLLEPVVEQLNPSHFAALWQELHFELAETAATMLDIKQARQRPYKSVARLLARAEKHYGRFLDGFRVPMPDGDMPERVPEESEESYLSVRFALARLLQRAHRGGKDGSGIEPLVRSLREQEGIMTYLQRNGLHTTPQFAPMHEAAREFVELLPSKIRMASFNFKANQR